MRSPTGLSFPRKPTVSELSCIIVEYVITAGYFYNATLSTTEYYIAELSWRFCTFNVALMTFGMFIILRHIDYAGKAVYGAVNNISGCSYGIYLMHIFVMVFMFGWISPLLSFSTPLTVFTTAIATFLTCWLLTWIITKIPGGRYITG